MRIILYIGLLYLFLLFQLDKIRDPINPNKRLPYDEWIQRKKDSISF
jgi:hypothetical protein